MSNNLEALYVYFLSLGVKEMAYCHSVNSLQSKRSKWVRQCVKHGTPSLNIHRSVANQIRIRVKATAAPLPTSLD